MNKETVEEWIKYADENLNAGKQLFENNPKEFKTTVCFLMQQAVEKYLKAYLVSNDIEIKETNKNKIHDIGRLINDCEKIDPGFNSLFKFNPDILSKHAVNSRYPFPSKIITLEDERTAISIAEQVKTFINEKINIKQNLSQENSAALKPAPEPNTPKPDSFTQDLQNRQEQKNKIKFKR